MLIKYESGLISLDQFPRGKGRTLREVDATGQSGGTRTGRDGAVVWALIVISCVLLVLGTVAVGVERVLLNTDRWVDAVAPLATDATVQASLADAAATQATQALEKGIASLPTPLQRLATPDAAFTTYVHDQALSLLETPQFAQLWLDVNRSAHGMLVQVLRGQTRTDGPLVVSNGALQLNVLAFIPSLTQRVQQLPGNLQTALPPDFGYVALISASALSTAQRIVELVDRATWVIVVAGVLSVLVTVAAAADRRLAALRMGIGVAAGLLLIGLGLTAVPLWVGASMAERPIGGAVQAALGAVLTSVIQLMIVVFSAAVITAVVAFAFGRSTRRAQSSPPRPTLFEQGSTTDQLVQE